MIFYAKTDNSLDDIEGFVDEVAMSGSPGFVGFVKVDSVYEPVLGGENGVRGYVKDGVAYEMVLGGPDIVIGRVRNSNS